MFRFMRSHYSNGASGDFRKNLFVVLLVIDPASHELGSPANPMRFTILLRIRNRIRRVRGKLFWTRNDVH
ncbi:hypothetical protein BSS2_I1886 [Brucella suis bv. 1 str. S2]|uniref:Uncharacterized protein n=1 Tax=Brucella suis biovar 1 (strain 1330) TaxID=204722 RepID=A0A0H3G5K5_BRUSU|nr:hypothetical protein BR1950 [Brucella suis 1330]AEU06929.1 hypothetical protein BSVBI22_A1946 [Brucella suis VBI22]AHN47534.1 hypothetical protein BSS2_I1886 [Brucella suis bv. 1 str. S2]AHZ82078.1 hypothetical protein DA85_09360 [Brucella canis]AJM85604.1 hypothetical protein TI82_08980 [Brucella suis]ALY31395.1 hypothetical protein AWH03_05305 [Brucella suis 019]CDL77321.1 unnamed protein product [Brucella canis str. Oliveri]